ncbi:5-aminovalerate aminotransferase DavT [Achromobacter mucicolens]|uniref:4-aminobutyrate--2-oxoglutarate transaminase n=1 Tax=Achromobacter mucicolens TaxID=1389922 RepID=UPI000B924F1B|nr:4-aminobutyrate--2-oxoglutarate transaminase [Achromobacter mucicolens]OXC89888.1 4-aminobutyrate--2-oxoglutarate transaminase [Achromobacter sp. KAs 3-5]WBX87530.1 4-aminobutyrate--2-oxoglutarate transaminase [Achromobacter mucicolens]CAB3677656.1 5-aminovalerate aminotransferase DavT [Achromobacter mucicolens]
MSSAVLASLPGPICQQYQIKRDALVARGVANGAPIFAARASGSEVVDLDGNTFLDFAGGIGTLNVGHAHPEVVAAVKRQADDYLHTCFNIVMYPGYIDLAEMLVKRLPGDWPKKVMLQSTGSEAVENAIKIARRATGRQAVVAFEGAFHGRTNMALALTAKAPAYKTGFGPLASEVYRAPFPYVYRTGADEETAARQAFERFERMVETEIGARQVAAVIIEPVQGEGGFHAAPASFMRRLREFCTSHGIVLIADEIQSGFCRTGRWFAIEHSGITADLYTLAKSMGGGMPIAAVVGRAELMDAPDVGGLGGTYAGNPLACAAALAAIAVMERDDYAGRAQALGRQLAERFEAWKRDIPIVGDARGLGAMRAVEIVTDKATHRPDGQATARIVRRAYEAGLILVKAGFHGNVLRFLGPLNMSAEQLQRGLDILEKSIIAEVRA